MRTDRWIAAGHFGTDSTVLFGNLAGYCNLLLVMAICICAQQASASARFNHQKSALISNCERAYSEFFKKDDLDFRIVFGYKDSRPARLVTDRYERLLMIEKLRSLGFVRDDKDDELLHKQIDGPDHQLKRIRLRVVESSVGADDEVNRKNPFQNWQSAHALESFLDGIKNANAIFYVGHSRKGGGPDFAPPRCTRDGHVDYDWYSTHRTGLHQTAQAIERIKAGKKLIGIFSCDSQRHFSSRLKMQGSRAGLITNRSALYYVDSVNETVSTIHSLIEFECAPAFSPPGAQLKNFF